MVMSTHSLCLPCVRPPRVSLLVSLAPLPVVLHRLKLRWLWLRPSARLPSAMPIRQLRRRPWLSVIAARPAVRRGACRGLPLLSAAIEAHSEHLWREGGEGKGQ